MIEVKKDWKAIPVYTQSMEYAREHNERLMYEESGEANRSCKRMIEDEIQRGLVTRDAEIQAVQRVFDAFGEERTMRLLANTLQKTTNNYFDKNNIKWAESIEIVPDITSTGFLGNDRNAWLIIETHPAILNDFVSTAISVQGKKTEQSGEYI